MSYGVGGAKAPLVVYSAIARVHMGPERRNRTTDVVDAAAWSAGAGPTPKRAPNAASICTVVRRTCGCAYSPAGHGVQGRKGVAATTARAVGTSTHPSRVAGIGTTMAGAAAAILRRSLHRGRDRGCRRARKWDRRSCKPRRLTSLSRRAREEPPMRGGSKTRCTSKSSFASEHARRRVTTHVQVQLPIRRLAGAIRLQHALCFGSSRSDASRRLLSGMSDHVREAKRVPKGH